MGSSTFHIVGVAPNYFRALVAMVWDAWRNRTPYVNERVAAAGK
jgi:hypothetical protein